MSRKNTPVPESAINKIKRRRPQSAPRGQRGGSPQKYSVYAPKDGDKKKKRRDPNLILGPEGTEEFDTAGKRVYFEPQGNLQDNEMRDKLRGNTKGILLEEYKKKPLNVKIPKAFQERMAKGLPKDEEAEEVKRTKSNSKGLV